MTSTPAAGTRAPRPLPTVRGHHRRLGSWLAVALVLRLLLALVPYAFWLDLHTFEAWGLSIALHGPRTFYATNWSDYPPAYMGFLGIWYWLYHLIDPGLHAPGLDFWTKLPACLADVANGYLIFRLLAGRVSVRSAYRAALCYLFNPVGILDAAVWGQMDPVLVTVLLGVAWATLSGPLPVAGGLEALAILIKPQGLFLAPVAVLYRALRTRWNPRKSRTPESGSETGLQTRPLSWLLAALVGFALAWAAALPFDAAAGRSGIGSFLVSPFAFLWRHYLGTANQYPYSSVNAYNLWSLTELQGTWLSDGRLLLGLPQRVWGLAFLALLAGFLALYLYRHRREGAFYLASATMMVGIFLLPTRMHERYLFPALAFLALAAAFNRRVWPIYWVFTTTAFLNMGVVLLTYYHSGSWFAGVQRFMDPWGIAGIALANMWFFGELLGVLWGPVAGKEAAAVPLRRKGESSLWERLEQVLPAGLPGRVAALRRRELAIPVGLACAFFLINLVRLAVPSQQIFDEVYHARTAYEYLRGINPYEWTHPPLAKLLIAIGIALFGMNSFGWRIVSLLAGSLALLAFFLLARRLLGSVRAAAIGTALLGMDGVFLVQSRVAMTNIYVVLFLLVAASGIWAYLQEERDRHLAVAGLGFAAALASRWSALYAYGGTGIFLMVYWWRVLRPRDPWRRQAMLFLKATFWLIVVPAAGYLLSYVPWMRQGHSLQEVLRLQVAMYDYHAHLRATHTYASPWYSWPLMWRPTWYYFKDLGHGLVAGVDCIGNPAVWWASVPAVAILLAFASRRRSWAGAFIVMLFSSLYLTWGLQAVTDHGRQLVFMHYMLEAIPFAVLAEAVVLEGVWRSHRLGKWGALGYLALALGLAIFFYPMWTALPMSWGTYRMHLWFRSWV